MKKIITTIALILVCILFSNAQDTIVIHAISNEPIELSAPQKYYKYYRWIMPNSSIVSNPNIQISFPNTGSYILQCEASDDCNSSLNLIYYLINVRSDQGANLNPIQQVTLYPNPILSNGFYVMINSNENELLINITITKENGVSILHSSTTLLLGENNLNYSELLSTQGTGLYYINIETNNYKKTFKIVKQ